MVALEAWALGKPVLANGRCDVLRGQCVRSNAGLYYENFEEFAEALFTLEATGPLGAVLGANGREFFTRQLHVAGDRAQVSRHDSSGSKKEPSSAAAEPLPGFFARRKRTLPPGRRSWRRLRPGRVVTAMTAAVHQILATLGYGDAIGHEVARDRAGAARGRLRRPRSSSRRPIRGSRT